MRELLGMVGECQCRLLFNSDRSAADARLLCVCENGLQDERTRRR